LLCWERERGEVDKSRLTEKDKENLAREKDIYRREREREK
jgi:hypothetical protein